MALLRMTAAALVACSSAGAEPGVPASPPPGPPPPGWKLLPALADAVAAAARADGVVIDAAVAFGEPAIGCYAVRLALHGPAATAGALADQALAGFAAVGAARSPGSTTASPGAIAISEVAKPSGADGVLALAFARPPYRGRLRAELGHGRVAAIACFANQREPAACDAACARLLQDPPPGREGTR